MNLIYIEPNAILRRGISLFLLEQEYIQELTAYSRVEMVPDTAIATVDFILIDTVEDSEFRKLRRWKILFPNLKIVLLSSIDRLLEHYLFAKTGMVSGLFTKGIQPDKLVKGLKEALALNEPLITENIEALLIENRQGPIQKKEKKKRIKQLLELEVGSEENLRFHVAQKGQRKVG